MRTLQGNCLPWLQTKLEMGSTTKGLQLLDQHQRTTSTSLGRLGLMTLRRCQCRCFHAAASESLLTACLRHSERPAAVTRKKRNPNDEGIREHGQKTKQQNLQPRRFATARISSDNSGMTVTRYLLCSMPEGLTLAAHWRHVP